MNVSAKTKWRSVPIDPELMAKGFSEGLLGIEELTDYSLVKLNKKNKVTGKVTEVAENKVVSGKKRPREVSESEESREDTDKPKKKKKRKKKKKAKKPTENEKATKNEKSETPIETAENNDSDHEAAEETEISLEGWKDLSIPQPVLDALKDLKYSEPTPIQRETLPAAINGHADILGAAETGSGKTLAFGIPIVHGILQDREKENNPEEKSDDVLEEENDEEVLSSEEEEDMEDPEATTGCVRVVNDVEFDFEVDIEEMPNGLDELMTTSIKKKRKIIKGPLRALILTPTRELAIQVRNHIHAICKYTTIKIVTIVGGMAPQKQIRLLDQAPEIVVATPGRFWDLVQEGHPHLSQVKSVRYLAIDETDRMVEKGHFEEFQNLLELMNQDEKDKKNRQTFVFSATLSLVHDMPKHLAQKKGKKKLTPEEKLKEVMEMIGIKPRPKVVDLTRKIGIAETLVESRIHCSTTEKDFYVYYFIQQHPGRTIVFCNSIDCVRRLVNLFGLLYTEPMGLHAQMHQKQRLKNLERFSANSNGFLIATDVAARGLDIPDVEHVIHYQVPRTSENYIHRSGRTARAKKEGVSVMLIDPSENQFYKRMCRTLNRDEDLPPFPVDDQVLSAVKVRVNTARQLDKLLLASKKEEVEKNWFKKAAKEADLEYSDDSANDSENEFTQARSRQKANQKSKITAKKAELSQLLALPLHHQTYSGKYPTMSGKLQLPSEFKTTGSVGEKSAVKAVVANKAEMKALFKGSAGNITNNKKGLIMRKKKQGQKHKKKKSKKG